MTERSKSIESRSKLAFTHTAYIYSPVLDEHDAFILQTTGLRVLDELKVFQQILSYCDRQGSWKLVDNRVTTAALPTVKNLDREAASFPDVSNCHGFGVV
jgi:hypothetical protein